MSGLAYNDTRSSSSAVYDRLSRAKHATVDV